jgi:orotate phosphoribosyltransferase-like protein
MVDSEVVQQIQGLQAQGWDAKRIAQEPEITRNTVKRYIRADDAALWGKLRHPQSLRMQSMIGVRSSRVAVLGRVRSREINRRHGG